MCEILGKWDVILSYIFQYLKSYSFTSLSLLSTGHTSRWPKSTIPQELWHVKDWAADQIVLRIHSDSTVPKVATLIEREDQASVAKMCLTLYFLWLRLYTVNATSELSWHDHDDVGSKIFSWHWSIEHGYQLLWYDFWLYWYDKWNDVWWVLQPKVNDNWISWAYLWRVEE